MDADLRAELDKVWTRFDFVEHRIGEISTRMSVSDAARENMTLALGQLGSDIKQINVTLANIALTLAIAKGGLGVGKALLLAASGFVAWASGIIHFGIK